MTCNFKAELLLDLRRSVASNPTLTFVEIGHILRIIDDARWQHQEVSGCDCWQRAIEGRSESKVAA